MDTKTLRSKKMARKIIGTVLLVLGGFVMIILLTYGGPIFPHIIGPAVVALIGGGLLGFNRKAA
jgi:hypothetical protein